MPAQSRQTPTTTAPTSATTSGPSTSGPSQDPQNTVGNSGVQAQMAAGATSQASATPPAPPWSKADISAIQTELAKLGLYTMTVDGLYGKGTAGGLTKVYGDTSWAAKTAADVLLKLKGPSGQTGGGGAATPPVASGPTWSKTEWIAVQTELQRLGLYRSTIDGIAGRGTNAAMVEAFGSDEWQTMTAGAALDRLKAAKTPTGDAAKKQFRMGEMARDGLLDITLGVGFDEDDSHFAVIDALTEALGARGFGLDAGRAQSLYKAAGRAVGNSAMGKYFVKEQALTYKPPAGPARSVNAVVRLVDNGTGDKGKEAAAAFEEGMAGSDVSYYAGHGRYGSGPDFDRNMSFDLLGEDGKIERHLDSYEDLERILKDEGKAAGRDPWKQFEWRISKKRLNVDGTNEGNVFLNPASQHSNEFGGRLMYWNLLRSGGAGAEVQTGAGGGLATKAAENKNHRYSILVFNGCRTQDYVKSIRSTPGMDSKGADLIASTRTLYWSDMANTCVSFLDGILGQQSAEETVKAMDGENTTERPAGAAGNSFAQF